MQSDRRRVLFLEPAAIACSFFIVLAIGWSRLFDPFSGDQALFLVGAQKLQAAGVLYRDFWDIKQPGVFSFFLIGGRMFGFDQIGEHVADLLWQLAFAYALVVALRTCLRLRIIAAFAPLAVVGSYYAGSSSWHLLQVEELVGLPIFCCAWLFVTALRTSSKRLAIASGLCAGIVLNFKAIFFAIVAAVVVAAVVALRAEVAKRASRSLLAWWAVGALVPVLAVAGYAVLHSTAAVTLDTTFRLPVEILFTTDMHAPAARLADSAMRFLLYFRGLIVLGLIGLVWVDRSRARATLWRSICIAWIVADLIVIGCQISSWWQYDFLLLVPPIGILATFGLEAIVRNGFRGYRRAIASLVVAAIVSYIAVPLPQGAIGTILLVAKKRPFESLALLERYRIETNSEYADALEDSTYVRSARHTSTVYVFGDPLIYVDSNTTQSIPMNSWAIQLFTPALWRRTVAELDVARPRYVFVFDRFIKHLQAGDRGATMALLSRRYVAAERTDHGQWYELASLRRAASPGIGRASELR